MNATDTKIDDVNEMDVEITADNKEKIYGFYSAKSDEIFGHCIYLNLNNEPVKVTGAFETSNPDYRWDDIVKVGVLGNFVSAHYKYKPLYKPFNKKMTCADSIKPILKKFSEFLLDNNEKLSKEFSEAGLK